MCNDKKRKPKGQCPECDFILRISYDGLRTNALWPREWLSPSAPDVIVMGRPYETVKAVKSSAGVSCQVEAGLTLSIPGVIVASYGRSWVCDAQREVWFSWEGSQETLHNGQKYR